MRTGWMIAAAALALVAAGCAEEQKSPREQRLDDERAIAEVEAAQTPPPDVVTPQRITADERTRFKLSESGCSFAVSNPELGAQAILQRNIGYMKFDGVMERFAPDAGSDEGPSGSSTRYDGATHSLQIAFDTARAGTAAGSVSTMPAELTLQDSRKRTVYVAEGTAACR